MSKSNKQEGFTKAANKVKFIRNRDVKLKQGEVQKEQKIQKLMCEGVCNRCREKVQWRFRYDKYKPLRNPAGCQGCHEKTVTKAYRTLCDRCASARRVCSSCCQDVTRSNEEHAIEKKEKRDAANCDKDVSGSGSEQSSSKVSKTETSSDVPAQIDIAAISGANISVNILEGINADFEPTSRYDQAFNDDDNDDNDENDNNSDSESSVAGCDNDVDGCQVTSKAGDDRESVCSNADVAVVADRITDGMQVFPSISDYSLKAMASKYKTKSQSSIAALEKKVNYNEPSLGHDVSITTSSSPPPPPSSSSLPVPPSTESTQPPSPTTCV